MQNSDYDTLKRRYLNRARIAFSDIKLLHEFVEIYEHVSLQNPFPLRDTISNLFHLTKNLSFRQNATQMFRDVLEGLVYHYSDKRKEVTHTLFATDIDHRVMTDMAIIVLSKSHVKIAPITHLLIGNTSLNQDFITSYFVDAALKSKATIILIPHVNWVNGARFDVLKICKLLKEHNRNLITIVDGAQALGNIHTIIDSRKCNQDIDFYISCGQKWLGSPIPIGFARVSDRFVSRKRFTDFIFTCDYFSDFGGNLENLGKPAFDTYNIHFSVLFHTVVKGFGNQQGTVKAFYYPDIINGLKSLVEIIKASNKIELLELPDEMKTGILAITGTKGDLDRLSERLWKQFHFAHTLDKHTTSKREIEFLRLSSPLEPLQQEDLDEFENAIKSLK